MKKCNCSRCAPYIILPVIACVVLGGCLSFCSVYSVEKGERCSDGVDGGGSLVYDFSFFNASGKPAEEFSVVLSLFDSNGEPALSSDFITADFAASVPPGESRHFEIDLRPFLSADEEEIYMTDYFYVSFIRYNDGSIWKDEFGVYGER